MRSGEQVFWDAFWVVHSERPLTMGGEGEIPFSAIDRYARRYGFSDLDSFETLRSILKQMDGEYLLVRHEQAEADQPDASEGGTQS